MAVKEDSFDQLMNEELGKRPQQEPPVDASLQADIEEELSALEFIRNLFEL